MKDRLPRKLKKKLKKNMSKNAFDAIMGYNDNFFETE